ncbi:hypothetical protein GGP41_010677 [Bipolaris sorokiniana]|uniref:Uncharacterized protein n=1 Tax=Cochliobolus sativus TaxID=45130 RepID=A0A8H6DX10_COCSA|nr:hypothetical protein GGP41_010677 [Bipolaris sorokiniana]
MASYKSQYPPSRRVEDRGPTTRLPQRSITPTTGPSQLPASSHSKLQKRRPSRDDEVQPRGPYTPKNYQPVYAYVSSEHKRYKLKTNISDVDVPTTQARGSPKYSYTFARIRVIGINYRKPSIECSPEKASEFWGC